MSLRLFIRSSASLVGLMGCVVAPAACDRAATNVIAPATLPAQINECETNTQRVCGTWSLVAGTRTYSATWPQGSKATITVTQFDADAVVFRRTDSQGPTPDMVAKYVAIPSGARVTNGIVQWNTGGQIFSGSWEASW